MVFLPGDHTLDMNITVANIPSLTMCGESSSDYVATPTVVCDGSVGLNFMSVVDFKIHSLAFTSCGRSFCKHSMCFGKYTLLLGSIELAKLVNCSFHNNLGTALVVYNTSIALAENNEFTHNRCDHERKNSFVGAAILAFRNSSLSFTGTSNFINNSADYSGGAIAAYSTSLSFTGTSNFINNSAEGGQGGAINAGYNTSLSFTGTNNFISNSAAYSGGAIYAVNSTSLSFTGTNNFINNSAEGGPGGAIDAGYNTSLSFTGTNNFISNSAAYFGGAIHAVYNTSLSFTGTSNFINNSAHDGGEIRARDSTTLNFTGTSNFIKDYGGAIAANYNSSLSFTGTSNFNNNSADTGGGAIDANGNTSLIFTGISNFINNSARYGGAISATGNTPLNFTGTSNFINNSAAGYGGGAISATGNTSLSFTGTSNFINNSATEVGGGMFLLNSTFFISSNTIVYWESNHAPLGGAIHFVVSFFCILDTHTCTTKGECFFQLPGQNLSNGIDAQFVFKDNSAEAGSVLYGGAIDNCKLTGLELYSSGEVFDMLVHIENDNTNSSISSDPFRVCPCENNHPDCSKSNKSYTVYPGETFHVSVVAVGQRNGIVPSNVRGRFLNIQFWQQEITVSDLLNNIPNSMSSAPIGNLHPLQYLQATFNTCTILNYTVFSLLDSVFLKLNADNPCATFSNALYLRLDVNQTCPPGFYLSEIERSCVCNQRLAKYADHCDITNGLGRITHSSHDHFWVGYDNESDALIDSIQTALLTIVSLIQWTFLLTTQTCSVHTTGQVSCVELARKVTVLYWALLNASSVLISILSCSSLLH